MGLDGKSFQLEADGLLSVCIQHEMDHLKGEGFRRVSFRTQAKSALLAS
jgi:peptide deformylase